VAMYLLGNRLEGEGEYPLSPRLLEEGYLKKKKNEGESTGVVRKEKGENCWFSIWGRNGGGRKKRRRTASPLFLRKEKKGRGRGKE